MNRIPAFFTELGGTQKRHPGYGFLGERDEDERIYGDGGGDHARCPVGGTGAPVLFYGKIKALVFKGVCGTGQDAHLQYPDVRLSNGYCNTDLLKALILLAISGIKKVRE